MDDPRIVTEALIAEWEAEFARQENLPLSLYRAAALRAILLEIAALNIKLAALDAGLPPRLPRSSPR